MKFPDLKRMNKIIKIENIKNRIFLIRGVQVMSDYHLADIYGVETKRLNEQVKRNAERFPNNFMFQLTKEEWNILQSQNATAKRRSLPYVFTEQDLLCKS